MYMHKGDQAKRKFAQNLPTRKPSVWTIVVVGAIPSSSAGIRRSQHVQHCTTCSCSETVQVASVFRIKHGGPTRRSKDGIRLHFRQAQSRG